MQPQQLNGHLLEHQPHGSDRPTPDCANQVHVPSQAAGGDLLHGASCLSNTAKSMQVGISLGPGLAVKQHQSRMTWNKCDQSGQHMQHRQG